MTDLDLSLKDRNLRFALLKAIADDVTGRMKEERGAHEAVLHEKYADEGNKSFDVKLPGGLKIGTISLSTSTPKTEVADHDALLEWAKENAPHLLKEHVIPAQPAQFIPATEERVEVDLDPKRITELLKAVKAVDPEAGGDVVDPESGQLIPGVSHTPGGTPGSFSVKYADDGREALGDALHRGDLAHLLVGTPLAALAPSS